MTDSSVSNAMTLALSSHCALRLKETKCHFASPLVWAPPDLQNSSTTAPPRYRQTSPICHRLDRCTPHSLLPLLWSSFIMSCFFVCFFSLFHPFYSLYRVRKADNNPATSSNLIAASGLMGKLIISTVIFKSCDKRSFLAGRVNCMMPLKHITISPFKPGPPTQRT